MSGSTVPAVFCVAVLVVLVRPAAHGAADRPNVITVAVLSSPNNLDPRIGSDETSQRVHQLVFDNLLALDDKLRVIGGLADAAGSSRTRSPTSSICARACGFTTATS